jgi:hypothetical protein
MGFGMTVSIVVSSRLFGFTFHFAGNRLPNGLSGLWKNAPRRASAGRLIQDGLDNSLVDLPEKNLRSSASNCAGRIGL